MKPPLGNGWEAFVLGLRSIQCLLSHAQLDVEHIHHFGVQLMAGWHSSKIGPFVLLSDLSG